MPIFEFRCLKCDDIFELLCVSTDEEHEMTCPKCQSPDFERVMSTTNYAMDSGKGGGKAKGSVQTRNCSGGSCTTWDIPGG